MESFIFFGRWDRSLQHFWRLAFGDLGFTLFAGRHLRVCVCVLSYLFPFCSVPVARIACVIKHHHTLFTSMIYSSSHPLSVRQIAFNIITYCIWIHSRITQGLGNTYSCTVQFFEVILLNSGCRIYIGSVSARKIRHSIHSQYFVPTRSLIRKTNVIADVVIQCHDGLTISFWKIE